MPQQLLHPPLLLSSNSLQQIYKEVLDALRHAEEIDSVKNHCSIGSGWGMRNRPTKELRYATLILENPRNRCIDCPYFSLERIVPRTVLGTLSDERDVHAMAFYDPKAMEFTDDGKTIPTNYGYRIRHLQEVNQIDRIIDLLKNDPYSRRAVIHIHAVDDENKKYAPCIDSIHFLIRNNTLQCQTFWRSENALTLLPVNIFEFTMLQELIASELEIDLGPYVHTVTSLHYYLDEQMKFNSIVDSLHKKSPNPMEPMPFHSLSQVDALRRIEKRWRAIDCPIDASTCEVLSPYWRKIGQLIYSAIVSRSRNLEIAGASCCAKSAQEKSPVVTPMK